MAYPYDAPSPPNCPDSRTTKVPANSDVRTCTGCPARRSASSMGTNHGGVDAGGGVDVVALPAEAEALAGEQIAAFVVGAAVWAPSLHNTQPWLFGTDGQELSLYADGGRQLMAADPAGRQMLISCGAALFTARLAVWSAGRIPQTQILPDPADPLLVARLGWSGRAAPADYERRQLPAAATPPRDRDPDGGQRPPPGGQRPVPARELKPSRGRARNSGGGCDTAGHRAGGHRQRTEVAVRGHISRPRQCHGAGGRRSNRRARATRSGTRSSSQPAGAPP